MLIPRRQALGFSVRLFGICGAKGGFHALQSCPPQAVIDLFDQGRRGHWGDEWVQALTGNDGMEDDAMGMVQTLARHVAN